MVSKRIVRLLAITLVGAGIALAVLRSSPPHLIDNTRTIRMKGHAKSPAERPGGGNGVQSGGALAASGRLW